MTTKSLQVLVTGATGFLGRALALRLHALGHTVTGLGRNPALGRKLQQAGIRFAPVDLTHKEQVIQCCLNQDVVFHCAALSSPWGTYRDFHQANVLGTRHVIDACQAGHVTRLVHVSTPSLYFNFEDRFNIREDDPLPKRACNHYAGTKRIAEQLVQTTAPERLQTVIIRPRGIFGPGDTTLIPRLIKANRRGGIPLIDQGQALVDITYIDNVVDALVACLNDSKAVSGQVFNISNGSPITLRSVLEQLFDLLGEPPKFKPVSFAKAYTIAHAMELASRTLTLGRLEPPLTRYTAGILGKSQTLDISRARQCLGYEPKVSIPEGLHRYAVWRREQSL